MPKRALIIYFGLAFIGAVIFVWFSFPVRPDKFSTSKNQPIPPHQLNNSTPANEVPQATATSAIYINLPSTAATPPTGKVLHVLAWGTPGTADRIQQEIDLYSHETGNAVTEVVAVGQVSYEKVLQEALRSPNPPDVVLVNAADLSGIGDPAQALLPAPVPGTPLFLPQLQGTFVRNGKLWALPDEFSTDVLFYNKLCFDKAGLGYPGPHWTLDILEESSRALAITKELDPQGRRIFSLELPADFDLWNLLSAEAGQPVCDVSGWHLGDPKAALPHERGLEFFQVYFRYLDVIVPLTNDEQTPGDLFIQNRAALCMAPIETRERFRQNPLLNWDVTRFPQDVQPRTNLSVRGWAITKTTRYPAEAALLAQTLCDIPVHEGWVSATINDSPSSNIHDDLAGLLKPMVATGVFYIDNAQTLSWKATLTHELQKYAETNSDGITVAALYKKLVSVTSPENQHVQIQTALPKAVKKPKF